MIMEVFKEEEDINEVSSPVSEVLSDSDLPKLSSVQGRTTGPTRRSTKGGWTEQEDDMLTKAVKLFNGKNWKKIAECFPGRSDVQCLHRWQKVLNPDLVKGPWTKEEDDRILEQVKRYGCKKWSVIAQSLPGRIGKQCRERWHNHLNPAIKKHAWTKEEELALIRAHQTYGNKWAEIAKFLPGRADNSIKNHWNCSVKKKLDSYLASGCSGDLLGINASDFYDHDSKEESIKGNVPNNDPGIICSLNQMDSDDGIDTSLGVSVLGVSNRRKKGLQTHSEPAQAGSRCLKEVMDGENELATGIWLERKCPIAQDLSRGLCGKYDNYGCKSGDLHRSAAETELSCGISSGESVMTMHLPENACEPVDYSNTSPRHPGEISLSMSTLSEPPNVKHGRRKCKSQCIAFPITTKRIPESPKRPRHYASPLHESSCMDFFPYMSSSDFGSANGQACRKSKAFTTTQQSEDVSFGTSSCESTKQTNQEIFFKNGMFSSAEKNLQLANSPVCCSPPPSQTGNIYSNGSSPETILRIAAKNFKNTPSIIRKRTHETSKRDHNAANDVCMSEARTGSSNASQGSSHSCDHVLAGQDDLTSEHLPNVKWLSLSSPGVQTETVKSVEKRLEYAFDLEWDDAKVKCGGSATEIGPIAGNVETMDNAPGSSGVMSNQNFMLLGLGVNCNL